MKIPPNKVNTFVVAGIHVAALGAIVYLPFYGISALEITFHLLCYLIGGFGITLLYHRVWTHNAATLSPVVEGFFALASCMFLQGPGDFWVKDHIIHHQHTDTEKDPYNIHQGFWWAHIEWIFYKPDPELRLPARLAENKIFLCQSKYYTQFFILMNVVFPLVVLMPFVSQPWWGILLVTSLRIVICAHIVWCVNSVCHTFGSRPFTQEYTARNVWWFPFTLGEQYHNYHHAFPRDYRNGIRWFDFDPTKWTLALLAKLGLATNLFTMPEDKITTARASVQPGAAVAPSLAKAEPLV